MKAKTILIILIAVLLLMPISCKKTTLNPKLFVTIQNEILDSDMKTETKKKIVSKYGITLEEYEAYEKRVESDPELKAKVGKERLKLFKQ